MGIDATMQRNEVSRELLARLARLEAPRDERVVSVYLDLDPSANLATPAARRTAITSVVDRAAADADAPDGLPRAARMRLRADVERVRERLLRGVVHGELAEGAHAIALFACEAAGLFEAVRLPCPVRSRVVVARRPAIQTLAEIGPARRWAVLLTDGDDARLLEASDGRLVEVERFHDEHRRRARRGVWAPEHGPAPLAKDELEHVRRAAGLLAERARERGWEQIAVGTAKHIWPAIEHRLPEDLRAVVIGRFDVDADEASPAEVHRRVEPLLRAADGRREREALDAVATRGVRGVEATLAMLEERRVRMLLLRPGVAAPGAVCPRCGWAAERAEACPFDSAAMDPHANVVERAVARAIEQDADVLALRHHGHELDEWGGIAALARF